MLNVHRIVSSKNISIFGLKIPKSFNTGLKIVTNLAHCKNNNKGFIELI